MSDVKRYDPVGAGHGAAWMEPEAYGDYVTYDDYAALRARLEAVEAANRGLVRMKEATEARAEAAETALATARRGAWEEALDAAFAYMAEQYGISALSNPIDRARITTTLLGYEENKL